MNGVYYYYIKRLSNLRIAREFCGNRFPKGDLVEVDTDEKIAIVKDMILEFGNLQLITI